MNPSTFLLYGANGYTGELIARYSQPYQLQPILAGRNHSAIQTLATNLRLPYRIFELDDHVALQNALREVKVVVNAAGPFAQTAKKMVDACLQTGTHYLDINGDLTLFELLKQADTAAKNSGIMVLPGADFDVVPTDCLAMFLKKLQPDAKSIQLAFVTLGGRISHGTAMSMLAKLGKGGAVRKNGTIVHVPLGHKRMQLVLGEKTFFLMSIPWGDISTAHFTTGIPDIETYTATRPYIYKLLKFQSMYNWLLRTSAVRGWLVRKINQRPAGPTDDQRSKAICHIWGQVKNATGNTVTAQMRCPEGYTFTTMATLLITKKILDDNYKAGYQTPASAYGADLAVEVPGVTRWVE